MRPTVALLRAAALPRTVTLSRTVALLGTVVLPLALAIALGGCETTAEQSARLEKAAKHTNLGRERGLSIVKPSHYVKVLDTQVLRSSEGTAAVVELRNLSPHPLRDAPIAITVKDAHGSVLFQNDAPGLEAALTSVALLPPRARAIWVDDQVQATGAPASVGVLVGEAPRVHSHLPELHVTGVQLVEEGSSNGGATGTVTNGSDVAQRDLVVYGIARRGGRIVAAGRAVVPEVPAHGSSRFEVFFVGDPRGARLQMSAPPTDF